MTTLALVPGLGSIGATELLILLTIILLVFGAKRSPELARGLGSGVQEFKGGILGADDEKAAPTKDGNGS